jgi:hypothetical protein
LVNKSILTGVKEIKKIYRKNPNDNYALISYNPFSGETDIIINNFSLMPEGIKRIINRSDRKILLDSLKLPVIFHSDRASIDIQTSKISQLPYGGYWIKLNNADSVISEGHSF